MAKTERGTARRTVGKREAWRCHACGETFPSWAAFQRHADETDHRRGDWLRLR